LFSYFNHVKALTEIFGHKYTELSTEQFVMLHNKELRHIYRTHTTEGKI